MPETLWTRPEVFAALVGVIVAFFLTLLIEWLKGRARRQAHWAALSAEMEYCRGLAETYLHDNIVAPLYRLPTVAYANSLPALLADAALNEADTRNLLSFFNEVETLNRGLDQAEGARQITDPLIGDAKLAEEFRRNRLKAEMLVPVSSRSYYVSARSVVDSRLRWYRL